MIELGMVTRMLRRGLLLAPAVILALAVIGGPEWALGGAVGLVMAVGNLWFSGRIIGGVAERTPRLLLPVGMATFTAGLVILTGIAFGLRQLDFIDLPAALFTLLGAHLVLVVWEAFGGHDARTAPVRREPADAIDVRS